MPSLNTLDKPRIYLDYEANTEPEPLFYVVGYSWDGQTEQVILNDSLTGLANHEGLEVLSPTKVTEVILGLALQHEASIVAFSEAEKNYFKHLNKNDRFRKYSNIPYINLAKASKTWISNHHKKAFDKLGNYLPRRKWNRRGLNNSLGSRMRLFGKEHQASKDHAPGHTSKRFKTILEALERKDQDYKRLAPGQKKAGTLGLKHNCWDVNALPVLFERIYKEDKKCFTRAIKSVL